MRNKQHKELSSGLYRPRVVSLKKKKELKKAEEEELKKELERLENESNFTRTSD